jgi:hypothetical protein
VERFRRFAGVVGTMLVAAAIVEELRKPATARTWNGRVFDLIPYDFRLPTLRMLQQAYWNPNDNRLFTDKVLGVGWSVNFYTIWRALQSLGAPARG